VTGGVVIGILSARIVAGLLSDLGGWRAVYLTSAGLSAVLALALARVLPGRRSVPGAGSYLAAVSSIPQLFLRDPVLRLRGLLALLTFATFSTFWTALVLPLSAAPFHFSHTQIGLFGLVGVAGALAAARAGGLADRGLGHRTTGLGLTLLLVAWAPIALLPVSISALIGGVLVLDLAVQAVHVTNQSVIVARHPQRAAGSWAVTWRSIRWEAVSAASRGRPPLPSQAGVVSARLGHSSAPSPYASGTALSVNRSHGQARDRTSADGASRQNPRSGSYRSDSRFRSVNAPLNAKAIWRVA
jgi:MFS family permease